MTNFKIGDKVLFKGNDAVLFSKSNSGSSVWIKLKMENGAFVGINVETHTITLKEETQMEERTMQIITSSPNMTFSDMENFVNHLNDTAPYRWPEVAIAHFDDESKSPEVLNMSLTKFFGNML